ncbi:MAG: hypothetical protein JO127_17195 [Caulobacteraceae bacterium]|nr:hypothetical protein [Caulobacteraceae bacterium]
MRLLDSAAIQPDQIDALGHLNVRQYLVRAYGGNRELASLIGLPPKAAAGALAPVRTGHYARYHREQRLGAVVEVWGGVLEIGAETARTFCELRNAASGEVAATVVFELALEDQRNLSRRPWPAGTIELAQSMRVELPTYAAPRTLSVDPPTADITFEALLARVGPAGDGGMSGLAERTIAAEECDDFGYLRDGSMEPLTGARTGNGGLDQPIMDGDAGVRFGWAVLELKTTLFERPRAGDRLRSLGAIVGLHRKARHTRRWTFDTDSGKIVAIDDFVAVAFDLAARRAIEIPPALRAEFSKRHHAPNSPDRRSAPQTPGR